MNHDVECPTGSKRRLVKQEKTATSRKVVISVWNGLNLISDSEKDNPISLIYIINTFACCKCQGFFKSDTSDWKYVVEEPVEEIKGSLQSTIAGTDFWIKAVAKEIVQKSRKARSCINDIQPNNKYRWTKICRKNGLWTTCDEIWGQNEP